jgi:hypothetical protein
MKLFTDSHGNVIGSFEGATEDIEANVGLPTNATGFVIAPKDLADRINDPLDPLHPHDLVVSDGQVGDPVVDSTPANPAG